MKTPRLLLPALAIWAILSTTHLHAEDGKPPLFLALFRLTVREDHRVQEFQTVKVIDLLSGSNNPTSLELPQAFIDQARKTAENEHLKPTIHGGKGTDALASFLYSPADGSAASPGISLRALHGAMNTTSNFRLLGQDGAVSTFGANLGRSAFFVSYYALASLPKAGRAQREAIIEAELQRNAANVQGAEILSRKNFSTDAQTIMEFICKSPRNKALTIRSRYICNDRQMLSLTTITTDGLSPEDTQSFDRLFTVFRFP